MHYLELTLECKRKTGLTWHFPLFIAGVVEMNDADEEDSSMTSTIKVA